MKLRIIMLTSAALVALAISACSGGSSMPNMPNMPNNPQPPTPTPSPAPTPTVLLLGIGHIAGADDRFTPTDGDTASGGSGQTIDTIKCEPMVSTYHVHAHLSIFVNGLRVAVPDAIGINGPGPESNGYVGSGTCFYHLHTHDADGYVHIEAPVATAYTLGQLFDIWGQPLTSGNVAGFTGPTAFYTAQAPTGYNTVATSFVTYSGDPRSIPLSSHEEIVLEVGPIFVNPPYIAPVQFYTQF